MKAQNSVAAAVGCGRQLIGKLLCFVMIAETNWRFAGFLSYGSIALSELG
jgi:hypothetical protein